MELSLFGQKFTSKSGILELMDDLGQALGGGEKMMMLGGGNPAHIPEVNKIWRAELERILKTEGQMEAMLANYDTPQGNVKFLETLAQFFQTHLEWDVQSKNIAVTTGSQNAFFLLFNLFAGPFSQGKFKKILFPLAPEYIGYADQALGKGAFLSHKPRVQFLEPPFFKYFVDFEGLPLGDDIGALCASRPTNPTGNVLTDEEVDKLYTISRSLGIPLILDNAYGAPFPSIVFEDIKLQWKPGMVLGMSLSKLGLPGVRTGLLVADEEVIQAVAGCNAVLNLSNGSLGQTLTERLFSSGAILEMSKNLIRPFYKKRLDETLEHIQEVFARRFEYHIHIPQGALFLWLWFPTLNLPTQELYEILKLQRLIVVPGHYFFFGMDEPGDHSQKCIRITYSQNRDDVLRGIEVLADAVEKHCGP